MILFIRFLGRRERRTKRMWGKSKYPLFALMTENGEKNGGRDVTYMSSMTFIAED